MVIRRTNGAMIRDIVKMHEKFAEEHDGDELLTERTYNTLKELCDTYEDDDMLNVKFNQLLKTNFIDSTKK